MPKRVGTMRSSHESTIFKALQKVTYDEQHLKPIATITHHFKVAGSFSENLNKWFEGNLPSLNLKITHYINFTTTNHAPFYVQTGHDNKTIPNFSHTKFLGITIDNTLSWRNYT